MNSRLLLALPIAFATACSSSSSPEPQAPQTTQSVTGYTWSYSGVTGPTAWGELAPAYATCTEGHEQSPIAITSAESGELSALSPAYGAAAATVVDTGYTIQVNTPSGGEMVIGDARWPLVQIHFHAPAEHTVNGETFPLAAHFVHQNDQGKLAVVGVLFREGAANPAIDQIWGAIPAEVKATNELASFDPASMLPGDLGYYAYPGSLTTPPCSEGVAWHVLNQPLEVSSEQLAAFHAKHKDNARPLMPLKDREVRSSF